MSRSLLLSAAGADARAAGIPRLEAAWWGAWTSVGLLFAAQLSWHYGVPAFLSLYWGLTDWSLWGLLGIAIIALTRRLRETGCAPGQRWLRIAALAPVAICAHVAMTMVVGALVSPLGPEPIGAVFVSLAAKKLTLNVLAFTAIAVVADRMTAPLVAGPGGSVAATATPDPLDRPLVLRGHRARGSRLLAPSEVLSACAAGNYIDLAAADGTWMVRGSLGQLEDQLATEGFVRASRSALVNLNHVVETRTDGPRLALVLRDGRSVPVAKRRRADVQRALRDRFGG